ncbi:YtpI-like protein [Paenibacillus uliginis N3/975]|uniref:YtpI-like protein n=2 Tax=Paenibacillus TaxID=44249 RepID=A0A1X7GYL3_9BACL|nr:YtpI family protein [Paenibacillus sp. N3/727]UNK17282.1 YtpI family protein [Paenibacillus sp. N3/727]SMF76574.1 YtpI-like protein [Paenibacillus uliginis N3/975]
MLGIIRYVLFAVLVISCITAALYSIRARKMSDPLDRGIFHASTNIYMGIMLVALSFIAMLMFSGSTPAVIVEAVFMVMGAFNIFAGIRSKSYYSRQKSARS